MAFFYVRHARIKHPPSPPVRAFESIKMIDKRIYTVSLTGTEPLAMIAGYRDGQLHIIKCERLTPNLAELKKTLPEKLTKLQKDDFIILVDEVIPVFAKYGRPCRLSDVDQDGRPLIVTSLEQYNNMMKLQAITFPSDAGGQFEISSSVVDEQRNVNGQLVYHVDWSELRPETTCLLLSIHAALSTNLFDKVSLAGLFKALGAQTTKPPHVAAFDAVTRGYDRDFLSVDGLKRGRHE